MEKEPQLDLAIRPNRLVGALAGALLGALLRFLVAISFVVYSDNWGAFGKDVQNPVNNAYAFTALSAAIGFVIGGIAGVICHPLLGAITGAFGSGGFCYCTIVVPMSMSHVPEGSSAINEVYTCWFAMVVVGAIAGGVGGALGRRGWKRGEQTKVG